MEEQTKSKTIAKELGEERLFKEGFSVKKEVLFLNKLLTVYSFIMLVAVLMFLIVIYLKYAK